MDKEFSFPLDCHVSWLSRKGTAGQCSSVPQKWVEQGIFFVLCLWMSLPFTHILSMVWCHWKIALFASLLVQEKVHLFPLSLWGSLPGLLGTVGPLEPCRWDSVCTCFETGHQGQGAFTLDVISLCFMLHWPFGLCLQDTSSKKKVLRMSVEHKC